MSAGVSIDYSGERGLTSRQRRVLGYLVRYVEEQGFPPSVREIGNACGLASTSSVLYQLDVLNDLGKIRRVSGQSRAIDVRPSMVQAHRSRAAS